MEVITTSLPDVKILKPKVFEDERGFFLESYNQRVFKEALQQDFTFIQDNHSFSKQGVLRGLHYQIDQPQGKLIRVVLGEVFDVAVDMRRSSPTFGKWVGFRLSASNKEMAWIPPGFAHGFYVLSETADFLYKCTTFYAPASDRCLLWNDPTVNIKWPLIGEPLLSPKDTKGSLFQQCESFD